MLTNREVEEEDMLHQPKINWVERKRITVIGRYVQNLKLVAKFLSCTSKLMKYTQNYDGLLTT